MGAEAQNRQAHGDSDDEGRAAFKAILERQGLALAPDEIESLHRLSAWMSDGLGRLDQDGSADSAEGLLDLSLFEQGRRLRAGKATSRALTQAALERIAVRDPAYRAFYAVTAERALTDAARADSELSAGQDRGALHGIPVGIKDMIDVAGLATTANAPGRAEAIATADAEVVRRLTEAGAVLIGKLATYEWGTVGPDTRGLFPPARNPWSLDHITGGSSSGCAVAAAGGLLRTTVGSDTGGSLRGPAFYCGVVGLKPTYGSVPTDGVLAMSPSLDHVGPISATVLEAAVTFDVIAGRSGGQSAMRLANAPVAGLSVGYARSWFADDPQTMPAVLDALDTAMSVLSGLGVRVEQVQLPRYDDIEVAAAAILHRESFDYHARQLREHPEAYGRRAFLSLAAGVAVTDRDLTTARRQADRFREAIDRLLRQHDLLVTVGALTTALPAAPFEKEAVWTPMRTIGFNTTGHPVLALPVGFHAGLPMGMQIVGRHHDEARLIQLGHAYERATDHSVQRPPRPQNR
jgi:aspartyl-tRNA(Asn)/glutamyl-tRNA(Gln) amidotransferase subunit A